MFCRVTKVVLLACSSTSHSRNAFKLFSWLCNPRIMGSEKFYRCQITCLRYSGCVDHMTGPEFCNHTQIGNLYILASYRLHATIKVCDWDQKDILSHKICRDCLILPRNIYSLSCWSLHILMIVRKFFTTPASSYFCKLSILIMVTKINGSVRKIRMTTPWYLPWPVSVDTYKYVWNLYVYQGLTW